MRAIVLSGGAFRLDLKYPDPIPAEGEVLVRVRLAGICGTDLELARGYMNFAGIAGHEFVGEAAAPGDDLDGKRVVGEINAACGSCDFCRANLERHCPSRSVLGILNRDGAFAEYLTLPRENLHPVPDSIPDEAAVFTEPIAAAYEIFDQIDLNKNQRVAVLGDGRLGALAALTMKAEQIPVVVGGHRDVKLALLRNLGIEAKREQELTPGFDLAIDCTGSSDGLRRALELVRPRGTVVLKSTAADSGQLNLATAVINEVAIVGSRCGRFEPALDALAAGKIDPRPLICRIFPVEETAKAFELARDPSTFKVLLRFA